ncbi:MAG: efflux RND transporter periplasmic adaptor subunit [Acidobacteria bacterium]|nr:MAG: efflux RND transporter periplasmic adaptor subunit [Acidobacteriota bacterium]
MGGGGGTIPVEVVVAERRGIGDYLETNGLLEAEREVDIVARTGGPIVELAAEEGQFVREGQVLARIDPKELMARVEVSRVAVEEARVNFERARRSLEEELISKETYDQTKARYDSAQAQLRQDEIQLAYTEIQAPFSGLIIERAIKFAEFVSSGSVLFRLSDFDPLLCTIQIPEKDLTRLEIGQEAKLRVEAFPGQDFTARVLRINPVIDATSGTVRVTLSVDGRGRLRPGMFASVFLEIERHEDALVIPRRALVLESLGDAVYTVGEGDTVTRRNVRLGFTEDTLVEVLSGLEPGDRVVVVGQDALTNGVQVEVRRERTLDGEAASGGTSAATPAAAGPRGESAADGAASGAGASGETAPTAEPGRPGGGFPPGFAPDLNDPQVVERIRERMRARGLSDEQIEQRLEQMRSGNFPGPGARQGGPPASPPGSSPR